MAPRRQFSMARDSEGCNARQRRLQCAFALTAGWAHSLACNPASLCTFAYAWLWNDGLIGFTSLSVLNRTSNLVN